MAAEFDGQVALITGAGSGIGRAVATAFADRGAAVAVVDRDDRAGAAAAAELRAQGVRAEFFAADVSDESAVDSAVAAVVSAFGRIDFAHNNAGISGEMVPIVDTGLENWNAVLAVDLTGVFLCLRSELRVMAEQGSGAVVNTASIAALTGPVGLGAYAAAKHAVVGLTKVAAVEHAADGIRVNAVAPGFVFTAMTEHERATNPDWVDGALQAIPMRRGATPEEIAEGVVWLCSPSASFVTGHVLTVDGGQLAGRPRRPATVTK